MANTNAPFGLRPFNGALGVAPNYGTITRQVAYNDSTKIYKGDPVKSLATGYVAQWTNGTAVSQMAGIFWGCSYLSTSMGRYWWSPYWPGSDVASGQVVTAYLLPCNLAVPGQFLIQTGATAVTFADIGMNADIVVGTGSTLTGWSGATLDTGNLAATATLPFRIMGLYSDYAPPGAPSTEASSYNWAVVSANVSGAGSTGI